MSSRSSPLFSIVEGSIVIFDLRSGRTIWSGRPLGMECEMLVQVDSLGVVLLRNADGSRWAEGGNLVGLGAEGDVIWRLAPPGTDPSDDQFVEIDLEPKGLVSAYTFRSLYLVIDPQTGEILSEEYVK